MTKSSAALIVVYALAVLLLLASVGYGYYAWRNYRRAIDEALQRRHARDLERGDRVSTNNYWIRDTAAAEDSRQSPAHHHHQHSATARQYHPIAVPVYSPSSRSSKPTIVATPLHGQSHK